MSPQQQYEMLLESLQLLAAPADEQLAALPEFVCAVDEVCTTFGDAYLLVPQLNAAGLVGDEAGRALRGLDDFLDGGPPNEAAAEDRASRMRPARQSHHRGCARSPHNLDRTCDELQLNVANDDGDQRS